jgi:hypothetical protein
MSVAPTTTVADYVGRTVDISCFYGAGYGTDQKVDQVIAESGQSGEVLTGIFKLAQRFLMLLLMDKGSQQYNPNAGSTFMIDARRGSWRTSTDVLQSFSFAMVDIKRQLLAMQLDTDPLDEQFNSVTILSIVLTSPDYVILRLALVSQAGTKRAFIAPIPVTLQ